MKNLKSKQKEFIYPNKLLNLSRVNKKIERKYSKKKISNIYNICYMNSSIQCLFHCRDFINKILEYKKEKFEVGKLTESTVNLIKDMLNPQNKNKDLTVTEIKEAMGESIELYKENKQEDANEFISNYLNLLHEEISDKDKINIKKNIEINNEDDRECFNNFFYKFYIKKGSSFILDLFYGILRTKKYCNICKNTFSKNFSSFNILELPIYSLSKDNKDTLNFEEILINYSSQKKILNAKCQYCDNGKVYSSLTEIYELPKYLIIYFGRYNDDNFIENNIDYPKEMDFKNFIIKEKRTNLYNYNYKLRSIIFYTTIGKKGHYCASCLNNNNWIYFDDHYIDNYNEKSSNGVPIILFYEKDN